MSRYCQKCGAEIPEGSPVCRSCFEPVKREGFLSRLRRAFGGGGVSSGKAPLSAGTKVNVKVTERIKIRDSRTGELREYNSLEEVPEEYREKVRQAREAARHNPGGKTFSVTDASGQRHTYNSFDEIPPDLRALIEKAGGTDSSK